MGIQTPPIHATTPDGETVVAVEVTTKSPGLIVFDGYPTLDLCQRARTGDLFIRANAGFANEHQIPVVVGDFIRIDVTPFAVISAETFATYTRAPLPGALPWPDDRQPLSQETSNASTTNDVSTPATRPTASARKGQSQDQGLGRRKGKAKGKGKSQATK